MIFKHVVWLCATVLCCREAIAGAPSSDIILNRAFVAAMNSSKKGGVDFNLYEKIINNKLNDYAGSIKIEEIEVGNYKFLIFRENSKSGALFISDPEGKIIFHKEEWGSDHRVVYPYADNKKYFAITRKEPMDNPGEHKEFIHVFEVDKKTVKNVLSYLNSTEYCILNPMLPKDVKQEIEGKFYSACSAKAVVKKLTDSEAEIQYTYKLEKDFLSDAQYQKVLVMYNFTQQGESVFNWTFKRQKTGFYTLTRGRTVHPITNENTFAKVSIK